MYGFSTVDGFMSVHENLEDMIKYLANEPSVGLYFVQQHAQNAMPNLVNLKNHVVEQTRETTFHTEDLEDSIDAVRIMTECGFPIVDEMVKDINRSLNLMSTSMPRRGLIQSSSWGSQLSGSASNLSACNNSSGDTPHDGGNSRNYFSAVFNSAKQRATRLGWSPQDSSQNQRSEAATTMHALSPLPVTTIGSLSSLPGAETDLLPMSSIQAYERFLEQDNSVGNSSLRDFTENYEQFQSEREAKFERWLGEVQDRNACTKTSD